MQSSNEPCNICNDVPCSCKKLEDKNIIEKHTTTDGRFNLASLLLQQDSIITDLKKRVEGLEEAMIFFSDWYNKTQVSNIILPDNSNSNGTPKIIL
jgi:hypothetical protein